MKTYLGDGVYIKFKDGQMKLTTEDGIRTTNEIFIKIEVFDAMIKFFKEQELL